MTPRLPEAQLEDMTAPRITRLAAGETLYLRTPGELVIVREAGLVLRSAGTDPQATIDCLGAGHGFVVASPTILRPVGFGCVLYRYEPGHPSATCELAVDVLGSALERMDALSVVRSLGVMSERVMALLRLLADERGRCPPLPQRDLAALLFARPETVCRALAALRGQVTWAPGGAVLHQPGGGA